MPLCRQERKRMKLNNKPIQIPLTLIGLIGLACVYIFHQELNIYAWVHGYHETWTDSWGTFRSTPPVQTILNKSVRYLLNDLFSILIIQGLFQNKKYTQFAVAVLVFGLIVLLPIYFSLVFYAPSGFSSMISHLHRIIMNPVLMMLLIPYFYFMDREGKA